MRIGRKISRGEQNSVSFSSQSVYSVEPWPAKRPLCGRFRRRSTRRCPWAGRRVARYRPRWVAHRRQRWARGRLGRWRHRRPRRRGGRAGLPTCRSRGGSLWRFSCGEMERLLGLCDTCTIGLLRKSDLHPAYEDNLPFTTTYQFFEAVYVQGYRL